MANDSSNHLPAGIFVPIFVLLGVLLICATVSLYVFSRRRQPRPSLHKKTYSQEGHLENGAFSQGHGDASHGPGTVESPTHHKFGHSRLYTEPRHVATSIPHPPPTAVAATMSYHSLRTHTTTFASTATATATNLSITPLTPPTTTFQALSPASTGQYSITEATQFPKSPKRVPRRKKAKQVPVRARSPTTRASTVWSDTFRRPLQFLSGTSKAWSCDIDPVTGGHNLRGLRGLSGRRDAGGLLSSRPSEEPEWRAPRAWDVVPPPAREGEYEYDVDGTPSPLPVPMPAFLRPKEPVDPHNIDPSTFPMPSDGNPYARSFRWSASQSSAIAVRSSIGGDSVFCTCDLLQDVDEEDGSPMVFRSSRGSDYEGPSAGPANKNGRVGGMSARSSLQISTGKCPACRRRSHSAAVAAAAAASTSSNNGHLSTSRTSSRAGSRLGHLRKPKKARRYEREREREKEKEKEKEKEREKQLKQGNTIIEGRLYES